MKIGLFSDLHLEFSKNWHDILTRVAETAHGVDLLINAGDTHHVAGVREDVKDFFKKKGFNYLSVGGNHDFYGNHFDDVLNQHREFTIDGVKVVTSVMWTDFSNDPLSEWKAHRSINDFRLINGVSTNAMKHEFNTTLDFIAEVKPDLVVTHFGCHYLSVNDKWKGDDLNPYFCPNALDYVTHKPKVWLHGHIHMPMEYEHEGTRVYANPYGYPRETYANIDHYLTRIIEL